MKSFRTAQQRYWHASVVMLAMLLPVFRAVPVVILKAARTARGGPAVTTGGEVSQLDALFQVVTVNADTALALVGKPCQDVQGELTRMATLSPYVRSLVLVHQEKIYCSPVTGPVDDAPLSVAFEALPHLPPGERITPSRDTNLVHDRPAVLVSHNVGAGSGVVAVVDGQYLQDIRVAASYDNLFHIQMLLSDTLRRLPDGVPVQREGLPGDIASIEVARSSRFPIEVRVGVEPRLIATYRREIWGHYAPFLVLAVLLCGYLAHVLWKRRLSLTNDIYRGMRQGEFHMVYQPVIRMETGKCTGVEALVRWRRQDRGHVRPDIFIPLAEDNGIIGDLTRHIFGLVAADLPRLGLGPGDHIGVNVSGSHLATPGFVGDVQPLLHKIGAKGPHLVLEVTEREALPKDEQVQRNIEQLRGQGVLWALDDFGTGQSSLSYLEQLHADFIKIDRSFVMGIGTDSINAVVLDTIIQLGQRLKLDLTAEGIETEAQMAYLSQHGVHWAQGYLFAPPLRVEEFAAWRASASPVCRTDDALHCVQ